MSRRRCQLLPVTPLLPFLPSVPLIAAIVAPFITLLDIPALSQRWYAQGPTPLPDPPASLAMSAVSLAFCVIANGLLVLRFSVWSKHKVMVVTAPLVAFWVKTIVEVVNLGIYGGRFPGDPSVEYTEGFWAAVFSCGLSGVCGLLLLSHFLAARNRPIKDSFRIKLEGRQFMLSVLSFVILISFQALVFAKIEGWKYFDAIYFSIVSTLTVGFGDFVPNKTSTRVMLFPFALTAICLLASQISMIASYFAQQEKTRRTRWRAQRFYLARQSRSKIMTSDEWGLQEEMDFLSMIQRQEERAGRMLSLGISLFSFLCFWFIGATIFWAGEPWTWAESLYFCYVFFLTIGYGDFAPTSPFSRVFFVIYSMISVPIIASFALQTIQSVIGEVIDFRFHQHETKERQRREEFQKHNRDSSLELQDEHANDDRIHSHAELVRKHWEEVNRKLQNVDPPQVEAEATRELGREALSLAIDLERQARNLLVATLPKGSKAQTLLRADRNVQRRDINAIGSATTDLQDLWEKEDLMAVSTEKEQLEAVRHYRQIFSALLVVGAKLRALEGRDLQAFLRTRTNYFSDGSDGDPEPDLSPSERADRDRQLMDITDGPVEVVCGVGDQRQVTMKKGKEDAHENKAVKR